MRNAQLPEKMFGRGQRGEAPACPPAAEQGEILNATCILNSEVNTCLIFLLK